MKFKNLLVSSAMLLSLNLAGCIGPYLPSPTEKKVKPKDIIGKWKYQTDFDEATVTLVLNSDGSFIQKIPSQAPGGPRVQKGKWELDGSYIFFNKALRLKGGKKWQTINYGCWIMDSNEADHPFTIFGGDDFQDDPDCGDYFERVP